MKRSFFGIVLVFGAVLAVAACNEDTSAPNPTALLDQQRANATREALSEQTHSYEIENIKRRRVAFGKPGKIGYVVFLNDAGQPIMYTTIDGKCTSSGKRLTRTEELVRGDKGTDYGDFILKSKSEDGTYGSSGPYIYCFTTDGRYLQWSGDYLYSDQPFDLTIKPLVVSTSGEETAQ